MNENKKWFVAYTRPGQEKKLADTLTRKKIENYCPLNTVMRPLIDRRKPVHEPLFNCYLFVRIAQTDISIVSQVDGILNMIFWLGRPAVVEDAEINAIKIFLKEHPTVKLGKIPVQANSQVSQDLSSFILNDDFARTTKNRFVKLVLPSLGYLMIAETNQPGKEMPLHDITREVESKAG